MLLEWVWKSLDCNLLVFTASTLQWRKCPGPQCPALVTTGCSQHFSDSFISLSHICQIVFTAICLIDCRVGNGCTALLSLVKVCSEFIYCVGLWAANTDTDHSFSFSNLHFLSIDSIRWQSTASSRRNVIYRLHPEPRTQFAGYWLPHTTPTSHLPVLCLGTCWTGNSAETNNTILWLARCRVSLFHLHPPPLGAHLSRIFPWHGPSLHISLSTSKVPQLFSFSCHKIILMTLIHSTLQCSAVLANVRGWC